MYYKKKKFLVLAISFYLAGTLQYTFADEALVDDEDAKQGDVIVSATRTEQEIKETPAAVQVITREEIEKLGAQTLIDALKLATSIQINSSMVGSSAQVRGMNTRHVLILIDGKRQVSEGGYMLQNSYEFNRIQMDNVERIEIVRGPVSAIYGSEGMAGVINVITRKPQKKEFTFSFEPWRYFASSDAGGENYFMRYDSGKEDKFDWMLSYGKKRITPFEDIESDSTKNQYGYRDSFNFESVYDLAENKHLDFSASFDRDRLNQRDATVFNTYKNERKQFSLGLRGSSDKSTYQIRTYYGEQDRDSWGNNRTTGNLTNFDVSNLKAWTLEGNISTQYGDNHLLTTGGEYRTQNLWGTPVSDVTKGTVTRDTITKHIGDYKMDSYAVYLQDEWLVSDKLLIIPAVRFDGSDRFSNNFSPKLGATYKLKDNLRLKTNLGKGFKAPTLDDMFYQRTTAMAMGLPSDILGNPNLKPEKSTSYEIGIEGEKGANFGKLTYFHNDVTDLIVTESRLYTAQDLIDLGLNRPPYTSMIGLLPRAVWYENVDKAKMGGVEIELGRYLNKNFTLKIDYTYLDATNGITGDRLTGRAKHQGSIQLHYDNKKEHGISAVLWNAWVQGYRYANADDVNPNGINKSYSTWNIAFNKKIDERRSFFLGVDNIFNKVDETINIYGSIFRGGVTFKI